MKTLNSIYWDLYIYQTGHKVILKQIDRQKHYKYNPQLGKFLHDLKFIVAYNGYSIFYVLSFTTETFEYTFSGKACHFKHLQNLLAFTSW